MKLNIYLEYGKKKIHQRGIFSICEFGEYEVPVFGWKTHVSATSRNFQQVLTKVSRICWVGHYSFKYISTPADFHTNISVNENPGISGKFITIYPKNMQMADSILCSLYKQLKNEDGPLVLSDYVYKDSNNIFFRYGLNRVVNSDNPDLRIIIGPKGDKYIDNVRVVPSLPNWISLPSKWVFKDPDSSIILKYHPDRIILRSNGGNVYRGHMNDGQTVIIKESRRFVEKFTDEDATFFDLF